MKKISSLPTHLFDQTSPSLESPESTAPVQHLLVDCDDGCITYSIQNSRGMFGLGGRAIALPEVALSLQGYGGEIMDAIVSGRRETEAAIDFDEEPAGPHQIAAGSKTTIVH